MATITILNLIQKVIQMINPHGEGSKILFIEGADRYSESPKRSWRKFRISALNH